MKEITLHTPIPKGDGGLSTIIYGSRGSGKTPLLLTIAQKVAYVDVETNEVMKENVVWRGRELDCWSAFPPEHTTVFVHGDDVNTIEFKYRSGDDIPNEQMPPIVAYTSCEDLYSKLKPHEYNVVYEPTTYQLTDSVKKLVRARGLCEDTLENVDVSPIIFWFDWLIHNKKPDPITIVFDDVDELFPVSPAGLRWYLNLWTKQRFMDFRKENISLLMTTHGYQDIDDRIRVKVQYIIYLKGSTASMTSLLKNRNAPILLDRGVFYIEKDALGLHSLSQMSVGRVLMNAVMMVR